MLASNVLYQYTKLHVLIIRLRYEEYTLSWQGCDQAPSEDLCIRQQPEQSP